VKKPRRTKRKALPVEDLPFVDLDSDIDIDGDEEWSA
jgi:hypothetical protein